MEAIDFLADPYYYCYLSIVCSNCVCTVCICSTKSCIRVKACYEVYSHFIQGIELGRQLSIEVNIFGSKVTVITGSTTLISNKVSGM